MAISWQSRTIAAVIALVAAGATPAFADGEQAFDWLRGSGKELELRLRGEVLDADGNPATQLRIQASMNGTVQDRPLEPSIEGNRFELWIPVNGPNWYSIWLRASSADNDQLAYAKFNSYQLREAAINGCNLVLESPGRTVEVKVTDQGEPVAGASVKADLGFGIEELAVTATDGIARLAQLPKEEPSILTAWTGDQRVGGFTFDRTPPRDPDADEHVVELTKCRDQKLRFIAEDGSPVPGIPFRLQVASPPPHYNFIGAADDFQLTTDEAGEAVCRYFPDWEAIYFYADIDDPKWIIIREPKMVEGVAVFTLKKRKARKEVSGRVVSKDTDTGGFYVHFRSFQGERDHESDLDSVFADADGRFSISVLPDATYCAYVQDEKWVGRLIHVLPYESANGKITAAELEVFAGQPVEVLLTSGPRRVPVRNQTVSFFRGHDYSWLEDGEQKNGKGGPQWWVTTDAMGKATTQTLPGELRASVYSPRWQTEKTVDVIANAPTKIELHREIDELETVSGRIVFDESMTGDFEDVEIQVASLDANYEDEQSPKCKSHGLFSFHTYAKAVGIFAWTKDGKAAGSVVTEDLTRRIKISLLPTSEYQGQLLGAGDQPAVGHPVHAYVRLEGKKLEGQRVNEVFDVKRLETKTDEQGKFKLRSLPSRTQVIIYADNVDGSENDIYVGKFKLEPNESQPVTVTHLIKPEEKTN